MPQIRNKKAKMKYIKFLDADDLILRDCTKLLMEILEKNSKLCSFLWTPKKSK